ncbi:MAG TPA: hypothetical protein VF466_00790 [Candidatus Saccharimonadales bacterium]
MSPNLAPSIGRSWGVRIAACTAAAGMALAAGGCDRLGQRPGPDFSASPEASFDPSYGVCLEPAKPDAPNAAAEARRCLTAIHGGSVVLVSFGVQPEVAGADAEALSGLIDTYTGGKVRLNVRTVPASQAATDAYRRVLGPRNCTDPIKAAEYAASIADAAMPELHGDSFVIGLSSAKPCNPQNAGRADQAGGRHADVFLGALDGPLAKLPQQDRLPTLKRTATDLSAHELMHLFGLGHAGEIWLGSTDLGGAGYRLGQNIDLKALLSKAVYDEYGDVANVMGQGRADFIQPSEFDDAFLDWPNEIVNKAKSPMLAVGRTELALGHSDQAAGRFAVASLQQPVRLQRGSAISGQEAAQSDVAFTQIAFSPRISETTNYGVEIVLLSGKTIAHLGTLTPENLGDSVTSVLTYGKQRLEVRTQGQQVLVRELPAA